MDSLKHIQWRLSSNFQFQLKLQGWSVVVINHSDF